MRVLFFGFDNKFVLPTYLKYYCLRINIKELFRFYSEEFVVAWPPHLYEEN